VRLGLRSGRSGFEEATASTGIYVSAGLGLRSGRSGFEQATASTGIYVSAGFYLKGLRSGRSGFLPHQLTTGIYVAVRDRRRNNVKRCDISFLSVSQLQFVACRGRASPRGGAGLGRARAGAPGCGGGEPGTRVSCVRACRARRE